MTSNAESQIEEFVEKSRALTGKEVRERQAWNNGASADAIRHFAYGIDDDNPLWLDPDYAAGTPHKSFRSRPPFSSASSTRFSTARRLRPRFLR